MEILELSILATAFAFMTCCGERALSIGLAADFARRFLVKIFELSLKLEPYSFLYADQYAFS